MGAKIPDQAKEKKIPSGEISLSNRQKAVSLPAATIRKRARQVLTSLGLREFDLSIVVVDDLEITDLNRRYFRRNRPTNVISFPMQAGEIYGAPPSKVLGDVVISAETARRQAEEAGRKWEDELFFLLIHGILHLAGYDHEGRAAERKAMEAKEEELSCLLKLSPRN